MSFYYQIYGLQITSSRRINLLNEKKNTLTDLNITWTTNETDIPYHGLLWERVLTGNLIDRKGLSLFRALTSEGICTRFCYHTPTGDLFFTLSADNKNLWISYDKSRPETDLDSYLVGPALGCILRLKGIVCLHASVVNINGMATAFLGKKRSGKSTLAAAFARLGYTVLADDIAVLKDSNGIFYAESGYPKVRLRPLTLAAIHTENAETFQQVYATRDSRYSSIEDKFHEPSLPLGAIYLLNVSNDIEVNPTFEEVLNNQKLVKLTENVFAGYVITKELRKEEFIFLGKLVNTVPIRTVNFAHNLDTLNEQCEAIIKDIGQAIYTV